MKNRGAAFGISVVTDENVIAHAIVPYGDDKLIVIQRELETVLRRIQEAVCETDAPANAA